MALHIENYESYLRTGAHQVHLSAVGDKAQFRLQLLDYAKFAQAWWNRNKDTWTKSDAIWRALESGDTVREISALSYLRFARTDCDGLSPESFNVDLLPAVHRLVSSSDDTVSEQARRLVH